MPHCKFFIEQLHSSSHNHPPLLPLAAVAYMRRVFVWLKCCCFIICTLCPAAAATAAAQSHAIMWVHFTPTQMQPTAPAYTPSPLPPLVVPLCCLACRCHQAALSPSPSPSPSSSSSSSWPCCSCTNCLNYAKYARHQTKSTIHPPSPIPSCPTSVPRAPCCPQPFSPCQTQAVRGIKRV